MVEHLVDRELRLDAGQARLVGQRDPDRHCLLAACGELGPVPGHRLVEAEHAALHQQRDANRGRALGAREDSLQVVAGYLVAAPQVDDLAPGVVRAELPARVLLGRQQPLELGGDLLESRFRGALDRRSAVHGRGAELRGRQFLTSFRDGLPLAGMSAARMQAAG
jgi:hypothetical protein